MNKEKEAVSIGLDVGHRHLNLVALTGSLSSDLRLVDFSSVSFSPELGEEERARQLRQMVQEKEISGSSVNLGICGESVIVRYLDLPKMKREEVSQALKYEAQQYIPFKMEEIIFDYSILEPEGSTRSRMKVLLVAAKRQAIMKFTELIYAVGLKPRLIDLNSFSLINCFQLNGPPTEENDVYALVNLELDIVNINILQGKMPYFTRDISLLEETVSLRLEAQQEGAVEAMRPLMQNLIREIQLSIDYFESEFEKQVVLIYLSGEGASVPELITFFNNQLSRGVKLWNPLQNLLIDSARVNQDALNKAQPMLALACGLALRK